MGDINVMTARPPRHPLLPLLLVNGLAGTASAVIVVAGLILADVGAIGTLVMSASQPIIPILLMTAGFTITLGSAAMGVAIMRIGSGDRDGMKKPGARAAPGLKDRKLNRRRQPTISVSENQ